MDRVESEYAEPATIGRPFYRAKTMAFVSLCPELDIASQGSTVEETRANLVEALTLFFETASSSEVVHWLYSEVPVR